ncbi:MAG: DMT family transporter [Kiloniellales bacterium]|nr:DMT family transporter [Kiloniellales bacterium]
MTPRVIAALTATVVFWASSFPGIGAALEGYPPGPLALLRFLVASAMFLLLASYRRPAMPSKRDWAPVVLLALVGIVVYHLALNTGQLTVSAGAAGTLSNASPLFTALWGVLFLNERLKPLGWLGIALGFAGAILIAMGEGGDFRLDPGAFAVLLAALSWSLYFTAQKRYAQRYGARDLMAWVVWAGTLMLLVFLPALLEALASAPLEATLAVVYLGVLPTALAYVTWAYVLSQVPVSFASGFLYLIPVLAFLLAWLWRGEVPSWLTLIGGTVALAGIALVSLKGR